MDSLFQYDEGQVPDGDVSSASEAPAVPNPANLQRFLEVSFEHLLRQWIRTRRSGQMVQFGLFAIERLRQAIATNPNLPGAAEIIKMREAEY